MFLDILESFGVFWDVQGCFDTFRENFGMLWDIVGHFGGVLGCFFGCFVRVSDVLGCFGML